jgi:hypothetical protein
MILDIFAIELPPQILYETSNLQELAIEVDRPAALPIESPSRTIDVVG